METTRIFDLVDTKMDTVLREVCEQENLVIDKLSDKNKIIWDSITEQLVELIETICDEDSQIICENYEQYEKLETEFYQGTLQDNSASDILDILLEEISPKRKHELLEKFFEKTILREF